MLILVAIVISSYLLPAPILASDSVELRQSAHPRLLFTYADQVRLQSLAETDVLLADLIEDLIHRADRVLDEPSVTYTLIGPRLLSQSRQCLERVLSLSMAFRLTGKSSFRDRAVEEMRAAALFPDWNPSHFLDVAEMTTAFALGYDWLFDRLTPDERAFIENAIIEKGLQPGLAAYGEPAWWIADNPNNWNQVCNGGLTLGALAVADVVPELATNILSYARLAIPHGMKVYAPDGQYVEGPSYWDYGTTYNALLIAALKSALDTDWGLLEIEGFSQTGAYRIHTVTPTRRYYNYADGGSNASPSPTMFWLASVFEKPEYAQFHRDWLAERFAQRTSDSDQNILEGRFQALEIVWYWEENEAVAQPMSVNALFKGVGDIVTMRSDWTVDALYVGFKGGKNDASHAHMDIGSFILEADAVRWALDLGPDDYNLPDYWNFTQEGLRWTYYRLNSTSHNTLVIDGRHQHADGLANITTFVDTEVRTHAVVDMTQAYRGQVKNALRGVVMFNRTQVLVQDELTVLNGAHEIRWGMVTEAEIELSGSTAVLKQDRAAMQVQILSPAGARFEVVSTTPEDKRQRNNEGTSMLAVRVKPEQKGRVLLAVVFTPIRSSQPTLPLPELHRLSTWQE